MDTIPFVFCDSVVGLIKSLPSQETPFKDRKWSTVLREHSANRQLLSFRFSRGRNKTWSCGFFNSTRRSYSFLENFDAKNAKYLCITHVSYSRASRRLRRIEPNTLQQLGKIYSRLRPFMDFSDWQKPNGFDENELSWTGIVTLMASYVEVLTEFVRLQEEAQQR